MAMLFGGSHSGLNSKLVVEVDFIQIRYADA